ncbi:hypothetical protein [Bradyrhizobium sp. OAE829]|uniref:hypothetical protein n=1 Tax=Bradyrhizobium sp. OAE829 TaxID=2663807 RepID=UPI0017891E88
MKNEKGACQGDRSIIVQDDTDNEPAAILQVRRISRLYAVTFATAATIAQLAYAVAR